MGKYAKLTSRVFYALYTMLMMLFSQSEFNQSEVSDF